MTATALHVIGYRMSPIKVYLTRDRFKVRRVNAPTHTAKVIELKARCMFTNEFSSYLSMYKAVLLWRPVSDTDGAITISVRSTHPNPAT